MREQSMVCSSERPLLLSAGAERASARLMLAASRQAASIRAARRPI